MKEMIVMQINQQVWAFDGQASGQREFADEETDLKHLYFSGGAYQVGMPNLTRQHITTMPTLD